MTEQTNAWLQIQKILLHCRTRGSNKCLQLCLYSYSTA